MKILRGVKLTNKIINFYCSDAHYFDHIAPIWKRIPSEYKGTFFIEPQSFNKSKEYEIEVSIEKPKNGFTLIAGYKDYCVLKNNKIIYMEHGIGHTYGFQHPAYAGEKGKDKVVLFLNQHFLTHQKNIKTYPKISNFIIGTPKMDQYPIVSSIKEKPLVCISFHWNDNKNIPEMKNSFNYYKKIIPILKDREEFDLVFHGHPKDEKVWEDYCKKNNIKKIKYLDEVLKEADIYICDNSSSMYEFAALNKPVIVLNNPEYRKSVAGHIRFWEYIPGLEVNEPEELLPSIIRTIKNPKEFEKNRLDIINHLYPYRGYSSQRAAEVIVNFLNENSIEDNNNRKDIKLSTTIMAHPKREKYVKEIQEKLGKEVHVEWDQGISLWDTARRAWLSYDKAATHHLVLQDDAILSKDLIPTLEEALQTISDQIVSICTIDYRMRDDDRKNYKLKYKNGQRWYLKTDILSGVATIVPTEYIEDMINYCDTLKSKHDDIRIINYCKLHDAQVHHSVPSLVDHRPSSKNKSLVQNHDNRNRGERQALIFIGEENSGLDLDWE